MLKEEIGNPTRVVSTTTRSVEPILIMPSLLLVTELKTVKITGLSETHGPLHGEKKVTLELPITETVPESAVFFWTPLDQPLIDLFKI
jgi:hypothetical protein